MLHAVWHAARLCPPSLFSELDDEVEHCYVSKQSATDGELVQMLDAIECGEFDCIRYRGSDVEVCGRVIEAGGGLSLVVLYSVIWTRASHVFNPGCSCKAVPQFVVCLARAVHSLRAPAPVRMKPSERLY